MSRLGLKPAVFFPIAVSWSSLFALGLIDNARGPALTDLASEFNLDPQSRSLFFFVASFSAFAHNVAAFRFLERESPIKLIGVYAFILAMGSLALGQAKGFDWVLVSAALMGIGFGGLGVGQNAALQSLEPRSRMRAVSGLHAMYGLASILAPLIAVWFFPDWRKVFLLFAAPSLAVAVFSIRAARSQSVGPPSYLEPADLLTGKGTTQRGLTTWDLAVSAMAIGGAVVLEIALSSRIASIMREEWGQAPEAAGFTLSGFFVALTLGRIGLSALPELSRSNVTLRVCLWLGCGLSLATFCLGGAFPHLVPALVAAIGLLVGMLYPLFIELLTQAFGSRAQRAIVVATTAQVGFLMAMHLGIGWIQMWISQTSAVALAATLGGLAAGVGSEALMRRRSRLRQ